MEEGEEPTPAPEVISSDMGTPAYVGSSPRSSQIVETTFVGTRTTPDLLAAARSRGRLGAEADRSARGLGAGALPAATSSS